MSSPSIGIILALLSKLILVQMMDDGMDGMMGMMWIWWLVGVAVLVLVVVVIWRLLKSGSKTP